MCNHRMQSMRALRHLATHIQTPASREVAMSPTLFFCPNWVFFFTVFETHLWFPRLCSATVQNHGHHFVTGEGVKSRHRFPLRLTLTKRDACSISNSPFWRLLSVFTWFFSLNTNLAYRHRRKIGNATVCFKYFWEFCFLLPAHY